MKAVFFDVGGTLIQPCPSVGEIYADVARRHGIAITAEQAERAFRESWTALKRGKLTVSRKAWWGELVFRTLGQRNAACFEELYRVFSHADAWGVYPDVRDALQDVRIKGLHVGVISNWDERLRPLLDELGIAKLLDSITISCEIGAEKPDPRIFRAALRAAGVRANDALHVGDSLEEDVRAAERVGMQGAWIDRSDERASLLSLVSAGLCA